MTWLALDMAKKPEQLISLAGFCVLVLFLFAFSKHHSAVRFSGVAWPLLPSQEVAQRRNPWALSLQEVEAPRADLDTAWGAELGAAAPTPPRYSPSHCSTWGSPCYHCPIFYHSSHTCTHVCASGACGQRNILVGWAEVTEVPMAFSPTFSNVLDNQSSPFLQRVGEHAVGICTTSQTTRRSLCPSPPFCQLFPDSHQLVFLPSCQPMFVGFCDTLLA